MSERDLEAAITEILESGRPTGNQPGAAATMVDGGRSATTGTRRGADRPRLMARRRRRRPRRDPLRTSLRLIFLAVVILCVPLMFLFP